MKKIGIALAIALLCSGAVQGQYGYQYQSGGYWFGAQFIGQEGWMMGKGAILHTTDGGSNWAFQRNIEEFNIANPPLFSDVMFLNPQTGWACGQSTWPMPTIWRTTDGGQFWQAESVLDWRNITLRVTFADPLHGWILHGYLDMLGGGPYCQIFGTNDGGRTWSKQDSSHAWFGVYAVTPQHCWVVGNAGWTGRTTDGGAIWMIQQLPSTKTLYDVFLMDTLFGWACGDSGAIVHSTDGGLTWAPQASGTIRELLSVRFLDRNRGFAVGDSGTLLRTSDGGASWAPVAIGVSSDLSDITFGDSLHGWVIGEGGTTVETSDGGLTWQVTRQGTTDRLQAVSFVDDQTGWASSWEGNIWGTLDGGKVWTKQASIRSLGENGRLFGLAMASATTGWAVGDTGYYIDWVYIPKQGVILGTQNGGATWTPQAVGSFRSLKAVFASDAQHAWACGNQMEVVGTSNGGQSWSEQFTCPETTLYDITFSDSLHGWGLYQDGHVLRTTNRGQSWGMVGRVGNGSWYHGDYVDSLWGWVAGDSGIAHTTDGGKSWVRQNVGVTERLWDVSGASRTRAWAVGENGRIIATTDGGSSWVIQTNPGSSVLLSVDFVDSLHGVACGWGYILDTRDGGSTWNPHPGGDLYAITLVDSLEGWAVGYGIYHTTDGGSTWQNVPAIVSPLTAVCFINRDEGWAGGCRGYGGFITHTTDRGVTWTNSSYWYTKYIYSLNFVDRQRGWMGTGIPIYSPFDFGVQGQMWATTDGGQGWIPLLHPGSVTSAGQTASSSTGIACGSLGSLFRTTDGSIWERVMGPTTRNLWGIGSGDQQTGWSVGWEGLRMATTDQGYHWQIQKQDNLPDSLLMSVQAFDGLTARATGYLGRSVLTTDGGVTWNSEETGTKEWLLASSFLTPTLGWVAGEDGMVLKYGRLPNGVEEEKGKPGLPFITSLGQNRPNPFSGETEIRYQLANKGKVRLVVYNVLGQAVRKLVEGEQGPGFYGISWDGKDEEGRNSASGIYFYRLETGVTTQTRKMVKVR